MNWYELHTGTNTQMCWFVHLCGDWAVKNINPQFIKILRGWEEDIQEVSTISVLYSASTRKNNGRLRFWLRLCGKYQALKGTVRVGKNTHLHANFKWIVQGLVFTKPKNVRCYRRGFWRTQLFARQKRG